MSQSATPETVRKPLFVLLLLCFAAAIIGDSTSEALLLAHVDASLIPSLFLVNAAFLTISSLFIISAIDRIDRGLFFLILCLGQSLVLIIIRVALGAGWDFLYLPLFSYAYVTKILFFTMFWTLANDLIDSRSAGRHFPFIAGGGTLGAIAVSFAIPWILKVVDARNLLIVWSAIVLCASGVFFPLWQTHRRSFRPPEALPRANEKKLAAIVADIRLVRSEPLLWNMAIFYFIIFVILINQHFTFYNQLKNRFTDTAALATFLGYFNGISMSTTFLLQTTCAGFVLRKAGASRSMVLIPVVLLLVFGGLTLLGLGGAPAGIVFWGVVAGMGTRIAFFDSFFSPNFQLFFSSFPQNVRGRSKMVLEGVVKPAAIVLASLWLLLVAPRVPFAVLMGVLTALALLLLLQTFRIKQHYAGSLVSFLTGNASGQRSFVDGLREMGHERELLGELEQMLNTEGLEIAAYITGILADMNTDESIEVLVRYLQDAQPRSRAAVVSAVSGKPRDDLQPLLLAMLHDPDERVVANVITALGYYPDCKALAPQISEFLYHGNNRIRANAIVVLWQWADEPGKKGLEQSIKAMLNAHDMRDHASVLFVIARIGTPAFGRDLETFLDRCTDELIARESIWHQFSAACAKVGTRQSMELLFRLVPQASSRGIKDIANAVRQMLAAGYNMHELVTNLPDRSLHVRQVVVRALFESGLPFEPGLESVLAALALDDLMKVYEHYCRVATLEGECAGAGELLKQSVIDELIEMHLGNAMYIAALLDSSNSVRRIFHRLRHDNRHVRARACEVLDNVGNIRLNRRIMEVIESESAQACVRRAGELYRFEPVTAPGAIAWYASCSNVWVSQCAAFLQARSAYA